MSGTKQFEELLGELETLAKAQQGGDDKIVAAAGGTKGQGEGGVEESEEEKAARLAAEAGSGDGAPMAKSFTVKLPDGTEVEAQDGTAMVKALSDRIEANEGQVLKALSTAVSLLKSLSDRVAALSNEGRGRKAMLTVTEKPAGGEAALTKSQATEGLSAEQFLLKAQDCMKAGRLTGGELMQAEAFINRNLPPPDAIVRKVLTPAA